MEQIWSHVYSRGCLNSSSSEHPVLLTEAPLNPTANRERMARYVYFNLLYYTILYCTILYYTVLYCTVLYYTLTHS